MSKNKKRKHTKDSDVLPFGEVDICRKTIEWLLGQASNMYDQLEHPDKRSMIAGTNPCGDTVFMFFKGCKEDVYNVKEFLEKEDWLRRKE